MSEPNNTHKPTPPLTAMQHHLPSLKLSFIAAQYAELAKPGRPKGVVPCGLLGQTAGRRSGLTARSRHQKPHSAGALPRHQNRGAVPLGLANSHEPPPGAASFPPP